MIVIGVVGGVAAGKSAVARHFEKLGAVVLDADRAGHEVLREKEVIEALRRRWGDDIVDEAGEIDRRKVAAIVFAAAPAGPPERAFLESVTHPRIGEKLSEQIESLRNRASAVVLDAALLVEAGWNRLCDFVVFVDVPRELRLARAKGRGWSEADFAAREAAQNLLDVKRRAADDIIDNSKSTKDTRRQVQKIWDSLLIDGEPRADSGAPA